MRKADHHVWLLASGERGALENVLSGAGYLVTRTDSIKESPMDKREAVAVVFASSQISFQWQSSLRDVVRACRSCPTVVVAPAEDGHAANRALRLGASAFVDQSEIESALPAVLAAVGAGQICVPRNSRTRLATPAFSHREKQVLHLLALGMTNCEIAAQLFLSESTVKTHVSSSLRKLGVRSRAEAAAIVLEPGSGVDVGVAAVPLVDGIPSAPEIEPSRNGRPETQASPRPRVSWPADHVRPRTRALNPQG